MQQGCDRYATPITPFFGGNHISESNWEVRTLEQQTQPEQRYNKTQNISAWLS